MEFLERAARMQMTSTASVDLELEEWNTQREKARFTQRVV